MGFFCNGIIGYTSSVTMSQHDVLYAYHMQYTLSQYLSFNHAYLVVFNFGTTCQFLLFVNVAGWGRLHRRVRGSVRFSHCQTCLLLRTPKDIYRLSQVVVLFVLAQPGHKLGRKTDPGPRDDSVQSTSPWNLPGKGGGK